MAAVYLDASALMKLCVQDRGSALAAALWERADLVLTSRVSDAQVPAALARARSTGVAGAREVDAALERWSVARGALYVVEATAAQGERAGALAARHTLRADDAWHLAAALTVATPGSLLATWDSRLGAAATAEGLVVVPW